MRLALRLLPLAGLILAATPAAADPCAAPLSTRAGEPFSGVVRYVGDGDSLCVGATADPRTWIEVRLADFDGPELHAAGGAAAKARLRRLALGRPLICVAVSGRRGRVRAYDRVIARCKRRGRSLGQLLRRHGGQVGGR